MDPDIARWILEFIFQNGIDDRLMKCLLSILPLSNDDFLLKKMILLKTIESEISNRSVSEKILERIESIVLLDKGEGVTVLKSTKDAYCSVAVDCTARFIHEQDKFADSVKRIWKERIRLAETVDLVSDQMRNWKDEFEVAVLDRTICENIVTTNTRNEALKAVRVYVAEAWKGMGPTFLELAAKEMSKSVPDVGSLHRQGPDTTEKQL